jgi:hypothetical protein
MTAYDFRQPQLRFACGHFLDGRPDFWTFAISLSKCLHFEDRWPRRQGSLAS